MTKVAIVQSNYVPWKGYFDLIAAVDEFILYDDVQYTRRDWRNRNLVKTPGGPRWITVPVKVKGRYHQLIRETEIDGEGWAEDHWKTLAANYRRAPHYAEVAASLEPVLRGATYTHLSALNRALIEWACGFLGIRTRIRDSSEFRAEGDKSERLASLTQQAGGNAYVSGPAARDYLDEGLFAARGLAVRWFDYEGYPPYPQLWGAFDHHVSVLDLLFNCGRDAPRYMRYVSR